jgi:DNA polymerase delta subunit 3
MTPIESLMADEKKDLQVLSDATRETSETCSSHDPLQIAWTCGTIANKNVKRRSGRKSSVPALPTSMPSQSSSLMPTSFGAKGDQSIQSKPSTSKPVAGSSQFIGESSVRGAMDKKVNNSKTPQLKRDSNIFKSFAKATPKLKREETDSSVAASDVASAAPSVQADMEMNASEDEDNYVVPSQPPSCPTEVSRKSRKEIKAELSKMMDTDSEGESKVIPEKQASAPENPPDQLTEEAVHVTDGRRRGRRMVMKKKTFEDEEGFIGMF